MFSGFRRRNYNHRLLRIHNQSRWRDEDRKSRSGSRDVAGIIETRCFFFSSRRRHTRLQGDWSSDVCSSDLMEAGLRADGASVLRGGRHARWDLEVRGGFFAAARLLMGVEAHAGGKQLIRLRWWPDVPARGPLLTLFFAGLGLGAARDRAWVAAAVLGLGALLFAWRTLEQCAAAMTTIREAVAQLRRGAAG